MPSSWDKLSAMLLPNPNQVEAPPGMMLYAKPFVPSGSQLNFEQRVLNPSKYPVIKNEDGSIMTHRMAWGEGDGGYYAYPTVVQDSPNSLRELGDREAWEYAMKTGEFRAFAKPEEAEAYAAGGYKMQWGADEPKESLLQQLAKFGKK